MKQQEMFDAVPHFDGVHYEPKKDHERLTGQLKDIYECLLADGGWMTIAEICCYCADHFDGRYPEPSMSAQLRNLRKERFGGHDIQGRYRNGTRIFEYKYFTGENL